MFAPPATVVSVDLDDAACYHAIHGLAPPDADQAAAALECWLPRFLELFSRTGVQATFFVIGRTLTDLRAGDSRAGGRGAEHLRRALAEGHELGNHGFAHAYDLVRWSASRQREDLEACDARLRALGAEVEGFRAPGYTHDAGLLQQVAQLGYRYDSSCLPSPPYYAAKLAVMASMALRGEQSSSLATGARSFFGPRLPYRRADVDLWELPMSVSPRLRIPLIGTSLLAGPGPLSGLLRRTAVRLPHLHLELHAIDLADPQCDPIAAPLAERQPELQVPVQVRHERLRELLLRRGGATSLRSALPPRARADAPA